MVCTLRAKLSFKTRRNIKNFQSAVNFYLNLYNYLVGSIPLQHAKLTRNNKIILCIDYKLYFIINFERYGKLLKGKGTFNENKALESG